MKVIIAGCRHFKDYEFLRQKCNSILQSVKVTEIVSGKCSGADELGERYAKERGIKVTPFPADWDKHGKKAGPIRNGAMAAYADALIAFDSGGNGTRNMINLAKIAGLKIRVIKINQ